MRVAPRLDVGGSNIAAAVAHPARVGEVITDGDVRRHRSGVVSPELPLAAHPSDAPLVGAIALDLSALPDHPAVTAVLSEGAPA